MDHAPPQNLATLHARRSALTLRAKLLRLILCVACTLVATLMIPGLGAINQTSNTAQTVSGEALESQAQNHLIKVTPENAARNALILDKTMSESILLANATAEFYSESDRYVIAGMMHGPLNLRLQPSGSYLEGQDEKASLLIPNYVELNQQMLEQIHISRAIDSLALSIVANDHNAAAAYLVLSSEITRYYPNIGLGDIPPDFRVSEQLFYANATPDPNPERLNRWTPLYDDPAGLGLMMSAISPIYTDTDEFIGVAGVDFC